MISTLLNVANFNVEVRKVFSMLLWRCVTSRCYINLNATLNRRWNVRWVWVFINRFQEMQYNVGTHYFILLLWKCVHWLRHFLQFYDLNIKVFNFLRKYLPTNLIKLVLLVKIILKMIDTPTKSSDSLPVREVMENDY